MKKYLILLPCIFFVIIIQTACKTNIKAIKEERFLLNTVVGITLYETESDSKLFLNELFQEIETRERRYSRHIAESEISRVNENPGKHIPVSQDTLEIIEQSLLFSSLSNGLYDITIGPLVDLWDIQKDPPRVPTPDEITSILEKINYNQIAIDKTNNTLSILQEGMSLDTGAIAKGFITDQLVAYLKNKEIHSAIINLGGNLYLFGSKPDGTAWNIGIRDPYGLQGEYLGTIEIRNMSVVTSGIYERYFEIDGVRYHHILNPKTGYPEDNRLASVTILSESSTFADGLSTTVFLLGLEDGMALIESIEEAESIMVTKDRKIFFSSGLKNGAVPFHLVNEEFTKVP